MDIYTTEKIRERLASLADPEYKKFYAPLIPTVDPDRMIGVRIPALRSLAKEIHRAKGAADFLANLPHYYYEENSLHGFLIAEIPDYEKCITEIERFLPHVDNWAICDSLRPKCFCGNEDKLISAIREWITSPEEYTVRFAVEMLMVHYLGDFFKAEYLDLVSNIDREEYYIKMMIAWYFATALADQWDSAIGYIEKNRLPNEVLRKAIQKAIESRRISAERKKYLKELRR